MSLTPAELASEVLVAPRHPSARLPDTEVTFVTEAHGRQTMMKEDGVAKPTTVKDPAALEAALAVVRKTVDDAKPVKLQDTRYVRGCLVEGKKQYCSTVLEGSSKRLDALNALAATLSP